MFIAAFVLVSALTAAAPQPSATKAEAKVGETDREVFRSVITTLNGVIPDALRAFDQQQMSKTDLEKLRSLATQMRRIVKHSGGCTCTTEDPYCCNGVCQANPCRVNK
ncbi:MAG TPA: hypothetical protein VKE70_01955 [Candidatus Solibacter sp.]|nr:hypothetical protein [Candidatus Solibacter sp.]